MCCCYRCPILSSPKAEDKERRPEWNLSESQALLPHSVDTRVETRRSLFADREQHGKEQLPQDDFISTLSLEQYRETRFKKLRDMYSKELPKLWLEQTIVTVVFFLLSFSASLCAAFKMSIFIPVVV